MLHQPPANHLLILSIPSWLSQTDTLSVSKQLECHHPCDTQPIFLREMILLQLVDVEINPLSQLRTKQGWHGRTIANSLYEKALHN